MKRLGLQIERWTAPVFGRGRQRIPDPARGPLKGRPWRLAPRRPDTATSGGPSPEAVIGVS
jgi:hypothetical protein